MVESLTFDLLFLLVTIVYGSKFESDQLNRLTEFKLLLSHDGSPACAVGVAPFNAYTVDRISACMYDCNALARVTSHAFSCIGFNYYESTCACQLFTSTQRLYFYVQSTCRYFTNVGVAGSNATYVVCPPGFTFADEVKGCYTNPTISLDWAAAALYCRALFPGAHLVFIEDAQENAAISTRFSGLQFLDPSATQSPFYWKYDAQTPVEQATYFNWGSGQPDDFQNKEKCVSLNGLQWNDIDCSSVYNFVCELDI